MPDGSITFSTELDNAQLEKELDRLTKKVESTESKMAQKTADRNQIAEQLRTANKEAVEAYNNVERLQNALKRSQVITSVSGPNIDPLKYAQELDNQKRIKEELKEQEKVLKQKEAVAERLAAKDAAAVAKLEQQTAELKKQKNAAEEVADQIERASGFGGRVSDTMSEVTKRIDKLGTRVSKLVSRVFVFTLITSALRSMRTWLGKVIQSNDEASSALARLKGALLTLAQPLVNVVIPAFTMLVNVLTAVVTKIAEFIAMLSGKSIQDYANSAKSLYNEMNAIEGVGEAAEEAAGSLAGFDEINTISTENAGGASGAAGTEIQPDFSWADGVSEKLKEIADYILLIAAGLALWKIGDLLPGVLGTIATKLGGILLTIGGLLLLWDGLTDAWENGVDWGNLIEMIAGLAAAATGLYIAFGPIAAGIMAIVGGLALLVTGFRDAMENGWNLQNTLLSIAGIMATGIGIALLTGSFIPALIAAILSLLLAFTVATGHGEELIEGIRTVIEGFKDFFTGIFTGDIEKAIGGICKVFEGLKTVVGAVIDGVRDTFLGFLDWLDEKTGGKFHSIIEVAKGFVTTFFNSVKTTLQNTLDAVKQIFTGIVQFVSGVFTGDWDKAWEGVKNIFKGAWNGIVSLLEGAVNLIIKGLNWLIKQMNKISFTVPSWVPGVGGKSVGINIPSIGEISIPRLATGAVIPPNREFLAVLGDQTSGNNIEAPESLIRKIVREEAGSNDNTALLEAILTAIKEGHVIMVGETVLGRTTVKAINNLTIAAGKPVLLI